MLPHLKEHDRQLFYKLLDGANVYFEYGSGGSTYQASIRQNIKKVYSVESDKEWKSKVEKNVNAKVTFLFNEMDTQPDSWGNAGKNSTIEQRKSYSDKILKLSSAEQQAIDLILIDGRFRVACCLKSFNVITDKCLIMFDDFTSRPCYHVVLDYYDIVDRTIDNEMVVLRKKKCSMPDDLILKYEDIAS
jgi:hypothetical protein